MTLRLKQVVNKKIEDEKMLVIGADFLGTYETVAVIPGKITADEHEIHIEGEKLILDITDNKQKFDIIYDEDEDEFIIKQGEVTFYIS